MTNLKDIFSPGDHGSTFGGNYLSTTAGLCVVDILQNEYSSGNIAKNIELFDKKLEEIANALPRYFSHSVGLGLMRGLRCNSSQIQQDIIKKAFEKGLILLKAGRNTVRFLPPLNISASEIEEGFKRLEQALLEVEVNE
jgi:acetylornithine aminotransferase